MEQDKGFLQKEECVRTKEDYGVEQKQAPTKGKSRGRLGRGSTKKKNNVAEGPTRRTDEWVDGQTDIWTDGPTDQPTLQDVWYGHLGRVKTVNNLKIRFSKSMRSIITLRTKTRKSYNQLLT